jgi:hypothetical protein
VKCNTTSNIALGEKHWKASAPAAADLLTARGSKQHKTATASEREQEVGREDSHLERRRRRPRTGGGRQPSPVAALWGSELVASRRCGGRCGGASIGSGAPGGGWGKRI